MRHVLWLLTVYVSPILLATACTSGAAQSTPTPATQPSQNAELAPTTEPTVVTSITPGPQPTETSESISTAGAPPTEGQLAPTEPGKTTAGYALRFYGTGSGDVDRVKVRLDDPSNSQPGPSADIGATDFTIEWWMRASQFENPAPAVECGPDNVNWIFGDIIIDRDRFNQDRKFGISLADGRVVFGVSGDDSGDATVCSTSNLADGEWHHVAVERRRSDGYLWIFVDGHLESDGPGPGGDVSYPDDGQPGDYCGGPCVNSDPFLVIGAEKHDAGPEYPSFSGWIDELRLSTVLRYSDEFARPMSPFQPDRHTAALWHFDEGYGTVASDSAPGGASPGELRVGGPNQGPRWVTSDAPLVE